MYTRARTYNICAHSDDYGYAYVSNAHDKDNIAAEKVSFPVYLHATPAPSIL